MTIAVVAEKPAVARDIAKVIGANKKGDGFIHGNGYVITWAIGHLVSLAEPHQIHKEWKKWRRDLLPMIPESFKLQVLPKTKKQFQAVKKILNSEKVERVVCATDAGREGELIFRYIYEEANCKKPISRLWISSLTKEAIKKGFESLRDGKEYEPLSNAAKGRSQADWLVGMNLSRAYSIMVESGLSVGRVQTPTLAMLVERELSIQNFKVEKYLELEATFEPVENPLDIFYKGTWFDSENRSAKDAIKMKKEDLRQAMRLDADGIKAKEIIDRIKSGKAEIESLKSKTRKSPPPLLYDLTELQRHANRLYGISAKKTLQIAQKLYEGRKLLSYPRTDSRHLSEDMADTLPKIVNNIKSPYMKLIPENIGQIPLDKRYINDKKVTDHHAIIPTPVNASKMQLTPDEKKIYDLVCRRLLMAWMDENISKVTTVITTVKNDNSNICDRFISSGTAIEQEGWKVLDINIKKKKKKSSKNKEDDESQALPPGLKRGNKQSVKNIEALEKQTKPPRRFTDATLLTAMETAGKEVDDKELSDAMKERGLGTPATRAAIIETLLNRGFIERSGKTFEATPKGIRLIHIVHPKVKSPEMTGEWEHRLKLIEQNEDKLDDFMQQIEDYVREVVKEVLSGRSLKNVPPPQTDTPPPPEDSDYYGEPMPVTKTAPKKTAGKNLATAKKTVQPELAAQKKSNIKNNTSAKVQLTKQDKTAAKPVSSENLLQLLQDRFGFDEFRPHQKKVCDSLLKGKDSLLVMPTGAGKSLCYQLPGIALGGTTIVISPLIALMEDQVIKLKQSGFNAERIHSGRTREESRRVCVDYLQGELDYLFIAPERLAVKGFPEMLAKRKPALIAVDEAHCISHWGHDFRPDYRLLNERLPLLRPAPVVATTATATKRVQEDIVNQLGLKNSESYICGFRRDNISIEVVELASRFREDAVCKLLSDDNLRPAIVYAPTRKKADQMAEELNKNIPTKAYHAGMTAKNRDLVQTHFLENKLEVIVATIAFGMGIDKPDIRSVIHLAMPSSIENYYQEIGRAGRDGEESKAILYYAYADRKVHEFFLDKNYPPQDTLKSIYNLLDESKQSKQDIFLRSNLTDEAFENALEKLWINGGVLIDPDENLTRGKDNWEIAYNEQREYKEAMLEMMNRFASSSACRMLKLIEHFGDREDSGEPCGICDFCAPENNIASVKRMPSQTEEKYILTTLDLLRDVDGISTGQLYQKVCPTEILSRNSFEKLLEAMLRADLVNIVDKTFLKNGNTIYYKRVEITADGFRFTEDQMEKISIIGVGKFVSRTKSGKKTAKSKSKHFSMSDTNPKVYDALKEWRTKTARQKNIPPFTILHNKTLLELAATLPKDEESLLTVHGMGPALYKKYGKKILQIISDNT